MARRTRPAQRRRKQIASLPVRFTDAEIIAERWKPPFPNDQGYYAEPGAVLAGGRPDSKMPTELPCGKGIVIYSSWADWVANCAGFQGPNAGFNAITQTALANAIKAANRIKCVGECEKFVVELWRGWSCGPEQKGFIACGAVEVLVRCGVGGLPDIEL
ncbi:MAG TPA: hypothetical protein VFB16_13055 [Bauldia sp.]|nr:hypothetical protein [Bauldia sp.]